MVEMYWSRKPGKFTNKLNGEDMSKWTSWCGSVREWYETLIEVMRDVSNTLVWRGIPVETVRSVRLVANPNVAIIAESTVLYGTWYGDLLLSIERDDNMGPQIEFVDRETGEVLGIVRVLDMNPCLDV